MRGLLLCIGLLADFEDGEEGFLWDVDFADALHALFAFFLLVEQLALAADVAWIAHVEHVLMALTVSRLFRIAASLCEVAAGNSL